MPCTSVVASAARVARRSCRSSSKSAGVVAVKAGTLDDKSDVQPTVEVWCVDRQPWVTLPGMAVSLERE